MFGSALTALLAGLLCCGTVAHAEPPAKRKPPTGAANAPTSGPDLGRPPSADAPALAATAAPAAVADPAADAPFCALRGRQGDIVDCPITLFTSGGAAVSALQGRLRYDMQGAELLGYYQGEVELGRGTPTLSTGHTFAMWPAEPRTARGETNFMVVHMTDPSAALPAQAGKPVFTIRFLLLADCPPSEPRWVSMGGVSATAPSTLPLAIDRDSAGNFRLSPKPLR